MKDSDVVCVQKVDDSKTSMLSEARKNFKRKLSYKLSFQSEDQMIRAIKMLKSSYDYGDGFEFDVSGIIADEAPVVKI